MSNFNKNGWVSLAQICEERQLVIDAAVSYTHLTLPTT